MQNRSVFNKLSTRKGSYLNRTRIKIKKEIATETGFEPIKFKIIKSNGLPL